jgi:hypothetical protein
MEAPAHGEEPGSRYVGSDSEAFQYEVVLPDAYLAGKEDWVWDEGLGELRPLSSEEIAEQEFTAVKTDKLVDFFIHALEEVIAVVPEAEGTYNNVPKDLLDKAQVAHFLASAESHMGDSTKLNMMIQVLGKLRMKRQTVGGMTPTTATLDDLNAVSWE